MKTPLLPTAMALSLILSGCSPRGEKETGALKLQDPPPEASGPSSAPAKARGAPAALADPPPSPSDGAWVEVGKGTLRQHYPAVGIFRARKTTKVGSQVNGRVKEVLVDVGDRVKAGQELLRLDPPFFEIEVAQKRADLDAAKVGLEDAELNLNRMKNLWEKPDGKEPSIPRKLFDDARSRHDAGRARIKQAEESLRNAEERLRETVLRAPYDGVVSRRLVDPGEPVTSAPVISLLEVQEIDTLDLEFSLPQEMLSRVRAGTPVDFEVEGVEGGAGSGEIAVIHPAIDETTRSFRSRVLVRNEDLKFRPGLLVKVRVVDREARDVLSIPSGAVSQTASGWQALVQKDGRPARRAVQLGLRSEAQVEVREGLAEGDKVWVPR